MGRLRARPATAGRAGVADRVADLYAEHAESLWGYLLRLTSDPHVAEDLVQETLLRALQDPGTAHREPQHQRSWMYVVARNLATDRARGAWSRREAVSAEPPEPAGAPSPAWVDQVLDRWLVADALASLSAAHRDVIVRAYYQDRSVAAIAEELQIAPGTVKSRMHHGMRALRGALMERGVTSL